TPAQACVALADGMEADDREVGCGPFSYPVYALPGDLIVRVSAKGHASKDVRLSDAKAGSQETVTAALEALGTTAKAVPDAPGEPDDGGFPALPLAAAAGGLAIVA